MVKKTKTTNTKKCGDCIHVHACETWNEGQLENAKADHCALYETVKESNAYYLGLCDGKDKGNEEMPDDSISEKLHENILRALKETRVDLEFFADDAKRLSKHFEYLDKALRGPENDK